MKYLIISIAAVLLFLSSCALQKDALEGISGDPVFFIQVTNGGPGISNVTAGTDSVYLFTSYEEEAQGFATHTGRFAKEKCINTPGCPGEIAFSFRTNSILPLYQPRNIPFLTNTVDSFYQVMVIPQDTIGRVVAISLEDNSGASSSFPLVSNITDSSTTIAVSLTSPANGVTTSVAQTLVPSNPDQCQAVHLLARVENGQVELQTDISGGDFAFSWGTTSNTATSAYVVGAEYAVTVTSTDQSCTTVLSVGNLPATTNGQWIVTPDFITEVTGPFPPEQRNGVVITVVDPTGNMMTTTGATQSESSFFTILSAKDYLSNENGEKTIQMKIQFNCQMTSPLSSSVQNFSGKGVIAVARPF